MTDAEFQAVFDEHRNAVYRFVWRMARSPAAAEDITQDRALHSTSGAVPGVPTRFLAFLVVPTGAPVVVPA